MVSVRKRKRSSKVEIYVKDNGTCVPKELVISFSTIFYHKTDGQETGLDLSLSYDIVKPHGGEIKVQSKEGEGSDFTIQLPRLILEEIGDEEYKTED